jgi:DNA-directed RNA polymerase subunit N (RpoN/RPB10)
MIIPVKCFTCGKLLADKYLYYLKEVRQRKIANGQDTETVVYVTRDNIKKTVEGHILDELSLNKICCRRHMLTHVDLD